MFQDSEFYLDDATPEDIKEELQRTEAEFWKRLQSCRIQSRRLERAKASPKAKDYFQRPVDEREGYDTMWISAIDNVCFKSLVGNIRNYGIQFADNFGDFEDGCAQDGLFSIEDVASYKARKVYELTGLPCIASRTSFEIEPIPPQAISSLQTSPGATKSAAATGISNPRVLSGYRINDIAMHVDYLCEALRPMSEPTRVTRFISCLCFYDGEMELFEYGVCEVDLHFADSTKTFVPMAQAINNMIETLQLSFGLEYQKFLKKRVEDALSGGSLGGATLKLRDRVLKDGKVLPNDIIDVSQFMDSQVDVNLMDYCAKELVRRSLTDCQPVDTTVLCICVARHSLSFLIASIISPYHSIIPQASRFVDQKPTKIMTVATTGLVIALPMAKYLQVPVVYARKERNVVMADTYKAAYSSKTVGKNRELLVSKSHVHADDRVLVIDDFLSSGASQEALLRIIYEAGATAVGVGVLLEKVYDSGRQSLSGFNVPIQSLCRVASVQGGVIQLVEEEGFEQQ
jgi:xanthine phosphoribosyltransferase